MNYIEWQDLHIIKDSRNPFSTLFENGDGSRFYIEPAFYTQLQGMKDLHPQSYRLIIEEMARLVKKNKKVVFTANFECPQTEAEDYIFLEITDVTDKLQIFVEDKSRGSDYGD